MNLHARFTTQVGSLHLGCDIRAEADTTVAVLGPNGAGKSTLLRVIAGLHRVDKGRVQVGDDVFEDTDTGSWMTPEERRVGFVFQDHGLFPHLTVLDNVAFGLRARGVFRTTARQQASAWLERVDLAAYASTRVPTPLLSYR